VNPNYTWAELAGVRPLTALNTLVCHHDALPKAQTAKYSDIELAKRIAISHINSKKNHPKGDAGMPYDLWIRNGTIYWCNDIEAREYGVSGHNGYTVNICVSGRYNDVDALTDMDRKALYAAILMMQEALPEDRYIKGHGEITPTACPGYDMDTVRRDIASLQEQLDFTDGNKANDDHIRIVKMFTRMVDLKEKYESNGQWTAEARRKLLLIDRALQENGFYS